MAPIFFNITQGSRLSVEVPATEKKLKLLGSSPCFFFSTPPGTLMSINPPYKDVPFALEKLQTRRHLIKSHQATILTWEAQEPDYPLLPRVKDQLERELKTLTDVTGGKDV